MGVYDFFNGMAGWTLCRISGALPAAFLNRCAARGVPLLSAEAEGELSLLVRLRTRDVKRAEQIARRTQCTLEALSAGGTSRLRRFFPGRALAAAGLALVLLLLAWSRLFIWEIQVTGNAAVPTGRILDGLRECGVTYGTFWPDITSDNLRSELLIELPELSWATMNIYGSRAEVIVRERVPKPEIWEPDAPVDVTAKKTGYVVSVRALNGTALVKPGSAVAAGETLISCQADSGFSGARQTHATGTVTAETWYELTAETPLTKLEKRYTGKKRTAWAVILGKNRWNFFGNSSISTGECDTIKNDWNLNLAGIFSLPVHVVRETRLEYETAETPRDQRTARSELERALHERLLREIGPEGVIETETYSAGVLDGKLTVCLRAKCTEEIGMEVPHKD